MKYFGYVIFVIAACGVNFFAGMGCGLNRGFEECEQIMRFNEHPCFPIKEEGWHYIHCDCCDSYIWHNQIEDQYKEVVIDLK